MRFLPKSVHFPEGLLYTQVPLYCDQMARYFRAFGKTNFGACYSSYYYGYKKSTQN